MKNILVLIAFLMCWGGTADAQVSLVEDGSVMAMIQRHKDINRTMTVSGWRIQIEAGTDRNKIIAAKADFLNLYPDLDAEWTFKTPYYKLKTGAFRTKLEAAELKYRIAADFPNAYIIKDDIQASEFLKY